MTKWRIFTTQEGGMSDDSATSAKELADRIDTPEESERSAAEIWAANSVAGDQFEFCNGVAVDVSRGAVV